MTPEHINSSIARALKGESGLDAGVLDIHGFSTGVMRRMVNNLCGIEGVTYCECGLFCGATFISAFNNNRITAIGIEDFSQDFSRPNVSEEFYANVDQFINTCRGRVQVDEKDCFAAAEEMSKESVEGYIDALFYDAHHDRLPTSKALPAFFDLMKDTFLFIADDTSWKSVRDGLQDGFIALTNRFRIREEWYLTDHRQDGPRWHNGVNLYLCEKIK